uniref:CGG triplet repeat-binding protein 1 n=1 Tax=Schizaphis graminum TaxID=13262 RepID=A0A2S2P5E1_SCHGA
MNFELPIVFCYYSVNMPKIRPTNSLVLKKYLLEFGENVFSCDESVLFCKLCETKVNAERRYIVTHHIETAKHQRVVNRQNTTKMSISQLQVTTFTKKIINHDPFKISIGCGLEINKVNLLS